jgi:hypothetical protein
MMDIPRRQSLRRTYKAITRRHKQAAGRGRRRTLRGGNDTLKAVWNNSKNYLWQGATVVKDSVSPYVSLARTGITDFVENKVTRYMQSLRHGMSTNLVFSLIRTISDKNRAPPEVNFRDIALLGLISAKFIRAAFIPVDNNAFESKPGYRTHSTISDINALQTIFANEKYSFEENTANQEQSWFDKTRTSAVGLIPRTRFEFMSVRVGKTAKDQISAATSSSATTELDLVGYIVFKLPFEKNEQTEFLSFKAEMVGIADACSKSPDSYKYHTNDIFGFTENKNIFGLALPGSMTNNTTGISIYSQKACTPVFSQESTQYGTVVPIVYMNIKDSRPNTPGTLRSMYNKQQPKETGQITEEIKLNKQLKFYLDNIGIYLKANNDFIFGAAKIEEYKSYDNYTEVSPKVIFINLLEPFPSVINKFNSRISNRVILSHLMQYLLCPGINVYLHYSQYLAEINKNVGHITEYMQRIRKDTATSTYVDPSQIMKHCRDVGLMLHKLELILEDDAFIYPAKPDWKTTLSSVFGLVILNPKTLEATNLDETYKSMSIQEAIDIKIDMCNRFNLLFTNVDQQFMNKSPVFAIATPVKSKDEGEDEGELIAKNGS